MRLPSESKQQLFLKNLLPENCLLGSGLGVTLAVLATVNTDQAFFVGSLALLAVIFNSLAASLLGDVFRLRPPMWLRILASTALISLLIVSFSDKIGRLPPLTNVAVAILAVSPLAYARSRAFADGATPGRALFDAAGYGIGLVAALLAVGIVREILGSGTLGALTLFPQPPLPLLARTFGGFLVTAAAMAVFRLSRPGWAP